MKILITILTFLAVCVVQANESSEDIRNILADKNIQALVGNTEISSVLNYGNRNYGVSFQSCAVNVAVKARPDCAPLAACAPQIIFDSSSVNCIR